MRVVSEDNRFLVCRELILRAAGLPDSVDMRSEEMILLTMPGALLAFRKKSKKRSCVAPFQSGLNGVHVRALEITIVATSLTCTAAKALFSRVVLVNYVNERLSQYSHKAFSSPICISARSQAFSAIVPQLLFPVRWLEIHRSRALEQRVQKSSQHW
jgi:hypothetical protein